MFFIYKYIKINLFLFLNFIFDIIISKQLQKYILNDGYLKREEKKGRKKNLLTGAYNL